MNQTSIEENTYIKMNTTTHINDPNQAFQSQLEKRASSPELSATKLAELYIETLSPKERKAYMIAREHLGMSFTLEKSVGFLKWKSTL
jgi:hypothetical protein